MTGSPYWKSLAAALLLGLVNCDTFAASFDCSKASTRVERSICDSVHLSELDSRLAAAYADVLRRTPDPDSLRAGQRDWLRRSRDACPDDTCLLEAYRQRINVLTAPTALGPGPAGGAQPTREPRAGPEAQAGRDPKAAAAARPLARADRAARDAQIADGVQAARDALAARQAEAAREIEAVRAADIAREKQAAREAAAAREADAQGARASWSGVIGTWDCLCEIVESINTRTTFNTHERGGSGGWRHLSRQTRLEFMFMADDTYKVSGASGSYVAKYRPTGKGTGQLERDGRKSHITVDVSSTLLRLDITADFERVKAYCRRI